MDSTPPEDRKVLSQSRKAKGSFLLPILGDVQFWIPLAVLAAGIMLLRFVH